MTPEMDPPPAPLSRRAQQIVDDVTSRGRAELRTSVWCLAAILATPALFLAVLLFVVFGPNAGGASGRVGSVIAVGILFLIVTAGFGTWFLRALRPRVKVVITPEGVTIEDGPLVPWPAIIDIETARTGGRGNYAWVQLRLAANAGIADPVERTVADPGLPLMLDPAAFDQKQALLVLWARYR